MKCHEILQSPLLPLPVTTGEVPKSLCDTSADSQRLSTCGRQSGRASKMTSSTPIGTVICSNCRPWATLVLRSTRPTLSWAAAAICRRPTARLPSLDADKLRRFTSAAGRRPATPDRRLISTTAWGGSPWKNKDMSPSSGQITEFFFIIKINM